MPAPSKTTPKQIVKTARKLLERRGRDAFSLHEVARTIGVQTPSLYGHFKNRAALILAVELGLWDELRQTLAAARRSTDPAGTLLAQSRAYRTFAKSNPRGYALLFDANAPRSEAATRARAAALAPAIPAFAALAGERNALAAARVLTPFLHGFVSMELAGAFRLGGGLDSAFENGVRVILNGMKTGKARLQSRRKASSKRS